MTDQQVLLSAYNAAIENAKNLNRVAFLAASSSFFGNAISLCILSSEEALKAGMLRVKSAIPDVKDESFAKVFKDHKTKHSKISSFLALYYVVYSRSLRDQALMDKIVQIGNEISLPDDKHKKFHESIQDLKKTSEFTTQSNRIATVNIDDVIDWWKLANDNKNNGLYVGIDGLNISKPQDFKRTDFETANTYNLVIIDFIHFIDNLFSDPKIVSLLNRQAS